VAVSLRLIQGRYSFCRNEACGIVSFSADSGTNFSTSDVRELVYQKRPSDPDVFICYCFRHKQGELTTGSPDERRRILENITTGIQADRCACAIRNPQGLCCLGNVKTVLRGLAAASSPSPRQAGRIPRGS